MTTVPGTRIGQYEIIAALGAGGMGEVYRARDTKLDRDVALKVLPGNLAADPDRLLRFEREARTLASLNHPHIAQIHGVVEADHRQVLVIEFVPGRTLDEVIRTYADRGGMPVAETIAIAAQIAEALEAAHELGIVHRDLKPANVIVRNDDVVKVLDFGLAKVNERPGEASGAVPDSRSLSASPTLTSPALMTGVGVLLGTATYMSPEQARGKPADKRSDIWAFGCVVYEMLTGRRLFGGDTTTEVIAAVIKDTPNLNALPPAVPLSLRQLLERCLERDPRLRLRDIGEARIALARTGEVGAAAQGKHRNGSSRDHRTGIRAIAYAVAMIAVAAAAGIVAWISKPDAALVPGRRFDLPRPIAEASAAALSPDGSRIAYAHGGRLYVHSLESGTATDLAPVPATVGALFWSPDGRTIGINVDASLRTISASGGAFFTVCKVPASGLVMAALWQPDNAMLFAVWRDSLYRVPASGGTPELHTAVDTATEIDFHSIAALPADRLAVTTHLRGGDAARLDVIAGGRRAPVANGHDVNTVRFHPPDKLLFLRVLTNPGVWVAPLTESIDLAHSSYLEPGAIGLDAAPDGTLIAPFLPKDRRELVWVTRRGATTAVPGPSFETSSGSVALSPDGRRAVLAVRAADLTEYFVVRDLLTGADTRVPPPLPSAITTVNVTWTPAQRLLYPAGGIEAWRIYDWPSDGSASGRVLGDGLNAKMTADGSQLYYARDDRGFYSLFHAPVRTDGSPGEPAPVFTEANPPRTRMFDVSPDGRLLVLAAESAESQRLNVMVATLPDLRERRQVTSAGVGRPLFSRDGHELFFLTEQRDSAGRTRGQLNVVSIGTGPLTIGAPEVLFETGTDGAPSLSGFDVGADGRLLMTRKAPPQPGDEARAVLRQNWLAALGK